MAGQLLTEIKCHSCSRICGEADGQQPRVWVLFTVNRIFRVTGCGVREVGMART